MLRTFSTLSLFACFALALFTPGIASTEPPRQSRLLFLGDSITQSGQYLVYLETILLAETDKRYDIINIGLASETVSGLSEPGHADGKFPRPDLHERLDRALQKTKPELVFACYGMNDGIYFPYRDKRFASYSAGILKLRARVKTAGAELVHLTPPIFDPLPIKDRTLPAGLNAYPKPFEGYNRVLDRYSAWLVGKEKDGWKVIDIHSAMNEALAEHRKTEPQFTFAKDGVHPGPEGHWVMTQAILTSWGIQPKATLEDLTAENGRLTALCKLVGQRQGVLKNSWLFTIGHKRPGGPTGPPMEEAKAKAAEYTRQIEALLTGGQFTKATVPVKEEIKKAVPTATDTAKKPAAQDSRKMEVPTPEATPTTQQTAAAPNAPFPGQRSDWNGFDRYEFEFKGKLASIVVPKQAAPGKPWVWHGEFFGHKPAPDIALLGKGYHIVYLKLPDMLGSPPAVALWNDLYAHLTKQYKFGKKPALVGLSRGGLYCYDWAIANPTKVSCIYADAPVCDFKSWPGGKGKAKADPANWQRVLQLWAFPDEAAALSYRGNPVDATAPLAKAKVPLLHVYGADDTVVPPEENTLLLAERYRALGGTIELIAKAGVGHHPHGLEDSSPIVNFIARHAK